MTTNALTIALSGLAIVGVAITYSAADDIEVKAAPNTARVEHAPAPPNIPVANILMNGVAGVAPKALDSRVAALEHKEKRRARPAMGRGPSISGPEQIAKALALTDAQREQMAAIYGRQQEQYHALHDTPNADGVTPNAYMKPLKEQYKKGFEDQDFAAVHHAMTEMGKCWEWSLPGTNETYGEASSRYLREATEEFTLILNEKQRRLYADQAYMGSFAVPVSLDKSTTQSVGFTTVTPGHK